MEEKGEFPQCVGWTAAWMWEGGCQEGHLGYSQSGCACWGQRPGQGVSSRCRVPTGKSSWETSERVEDEGGRMKNES